MRIGGNLLIALLALLGACGRYGFGGDPTDAGIGPDAPAVKPDGAPVADASVVAPDASLGSGGYTVTESTAPYAAPAGGVLVPGFVPGADDETYPLVLPFTFRFYGIDYTALSVAMNGFVVFGAPPAGPEAYVNDCPFDTTPPDAMIAVFWDDLFASTNAPAGTLGHAFGGVPPDRWLAIEWRDLDAWYPAGGGGNFFGQGVRVTQQLVLHETGVIEMRYGPRTPPTSPNKDCGPDRHRGCSATVGLEAPGSAVMEHRQCGTSDGPGPLFIPIDEGRTITFTPS